MLTRSVVCPALFLIAASVAGQESVCDSCADTPGIHDAPATAIGSHPIQPPPTDKAQVITSADTQRLDVVTIADMIRQLPDRLTAVQAEDATPDDAATDASAPVQDDATLSTRSASRQEPTRDGTDAEENPE